MALNVFGWDLLFKSVEDSIKSDQDVLVCFTHLMLISNGFKCIGLGDSKNIDGTETKSEILPEGWNENYAIRYVFQGNLYNLRATNMDDAVMINLIRVNERSVSMVQLNVKTVVQRSGSLEQVLPSYEELAQTIKKLLIDKVAVSTKYKDSTAQTSDTSSHDSVRDPMPSRAPSNPYGSNPLLVERFGPPPVPLGVDPFGVGRNDLNPIPPGMFGGVPRFQDGVGGGMLFTGPGGIPPRNNPNVGIPPGSLPPGARFDPFRPPDMERDQRNPRGRYNDEFPPPGFDDMFM